MLPEILEINNLKIPMTYSKSKRAKRIGLKLTENGLHIVIPYRAGIRAAAKAVREKESWIYKHYSKMLETSEKRVERQWITGETVFLLGKEHLIKIIEWQGRSTRIDFSDDIFTVYVEERIDKEDRHFRIEQTFRKLLRNYAKDYIVSRVQMYSRKTGYEYNEIRIKEQKTIWGSCSKKKNLNFNWKLIMTPPRIIDYVVLHELCHICHMNHSEKFWSEVEKHMSDYKEARKWLKASGRLVVL